MGIALLKKLNTCMPDPLKQMAAPVIRAKLIYNTEFQKQFNTLEKAQYSSAADIEKMQFEKLKAVLIHAYEHVPYYHKIFDKCGLNVYNIKDSSEISKIPTLDKAEIIANFDELQADDIDDFYSATTGGSTGTPLKVNLDRDSIYKERAFIYHFWEQHGYSYKSSKMASFRGTDFHGGFIKYNPLYNEIQLNPCEINTETISEYIKRMESFGVDFLHGFPSAIYSLCKCAKQLNIDLKNKYKAVFLISENIYDFQRKMIKEVLECDTFAFFGHTERAVFAEQIGFDGVKQRIVFKAVFADHTQQIAARDREVHVAQHRLPVIAETDVFTSNECHSVQCLPQRLYVALHELQIRCAVCKCLRRHVVTGRKFQFFRARGLTDRVGELAVRELDREHDRDAVGAHLVDQKCHRGSRRLSRVRAAGIGRIVVQSVGVGKIPQWEAVCKNHRFPRGILHYVLKFRVKAVKLLHIVPTALRILRRVRAVRRRERVGEFLTDARGVARGRPDVLIKLLVALVLVIMVVAVPFGLHSLDRLLVQQLDAVHERHDTQIGVIHSLEHRLYPRIRLAADVDEHIGIADGDDVLRRRLIGVHLAAGAQQHRDRHIVPADLPREVIRRKDRRDDMELAIVCIRVFLHRAAGQRRHGQHRRQQHT